MDDSCSVKIEWFMSVPSVTKYSYFRHPRLEDNNVGCGAGEIVEVIIQNNPANAFNGDYRCASCPVMILKAANACFQYHAVILCCPYATDAQASVHCL